VFTARYALSPYIIQISFVFKGSMTVARIDFTYRSNRFKLKFLSAIKNDIIYMAASDLWVISFSLSPETPLTSVETQDIICILYWIHVLWRRKRLLLAIKFPTYLRHKPQQTDQSSSAWSNRRVAGGYFSCFLSSPISFCTRVELKEQ
jgi:hypothetical protein